MKVQIAKTADGEPAFLFPASSRQLVIGMFAAALLTGGGIVMGINGDTFGFVLAAVCVALILGASRRLNAVDGLALTPTRIIAVREVTVRWEDVASARVSRSAGARCVQLAIPDRMDPHVAHTNAKAIAAAIDRYIREPERRARIGTQDELERLMGEL
ncbi:hypothetical protein OJ998_27265 [Solirubrobacter taibaiensis]|nr:hypothetical protein [Solirubrobacter taibaiensis]